MANRVAIEIAHEINELASRLTNSDRDRLSLLASKFVYLDAAAREIDLSAGRAKLPNRP
jgi:hypothetical protein